MMAQMRYVALLRGVNVGGNTIIKMSELSTMFGTLGFDFVKTYINSGNIAFDSNSTTEKRLAAKIEKGIEEAFGKTVAVMVRERREIDRVLGNNPFAGEFESHKEMHVLFMREEMPAEKATQLLELQTIDERFAVVGPRDLLPSQARGGG